MSGTVVDNNSTVGVLGIPLIPVTYTATHDSGTPAGQQPVVTFNVTEVVLGNVTINSTNGADAVVNVVASVASTLNLNANGGTISAGSFASTLSGTNVNISNNGTFIAGGTTIGLLGSTSVTYGTGGGTLQIGTAGSILNLNSFSINGFGGKNTVVDDKAITYSQVKSYKVTNSGGSQTYTFYSGTGGTGTDLGSFTVAGTPFTAGTYAAGAGPLQISADGTGNLITVSCFLAGTAIATPAGLRAVETIAAGDAVLTADGTATAVAWAGHRTLDLTGRPDADLYRPVRIAAGAIANGIPARDLRVTPDHAVLVDGHLIPARLLVNGTTIRQEATDIFAYYHLELPAHGLLLAEGLAAESYLDCNDRARFANSDVVAVGPVTRSDVEAIYAAHGCRKLTLDAEAVRPVWQALADRAASLGHAPDAAATTDDAGLHLIAGNRRIFPVAVRGERFIFALPAGASTVTIASRAARPAASAPWSDDRRMLGVQVASVRVLDAEGATELALDTPAGHGWYAAETVAGRPVRWTDGAATLNLPANSGATTLELSVSGTVAYPAETEIARAA
jgi:hypothetical protein